MRQWSRLVSGIVVGALCGACTTIDNDRLTIGPTEEHGGPVVALPAIEPGPGLMETTEPSLPAGLDRSGWGEIVFLVPNDGTAHCPHFTRRAPQFDDATARAAGYHPTALSALETGGSTCAQIGEALAWPAYGVSDFFLAIPRGVNHDGQSPTEGYERHANDVPAATGL